MSASLSPTACIDRVSSPLGDRFDPLALIRAVNELHRRGPADALAALRAYAILEQSGPLEPGGMEPDPVRAILVARLLFVVPEGAEPVPSPTLGKPDVDLAIDDVLCPAWPLVLAADIPFLPIGTFHLGGLPTPAHVIIDACASRGMVRELELCPALSPIRAVESLVEGDPWMRLIPEAQRTGARALVYGQALRAAGSASSIAAVTSSDELSSAWDGLVAEERLRDLRWDAESQSFA